MSGIWSDFPDPLRDDDWVKTPEDRDKVKRKLDGYMSEVQAQQQAEEIARGKRPKDMDRHDAYWGIFPGSTLMSKTQREAYEKQKPRYEAGDDGGRDD